MDSHNYYVTSVQYKLFINVSIKHNVQVLQINFSVYNKIKTPNIFETKK